MYELERRTKWAAESILGNERLTADLDDATAQELIAWGLDCVEAVVQDTAGQSDAEAREKLRPQLRAIGRMMRSINNWIATRRDRSGDANATVDRSRIDSILEQAAIIYGWDGPSPGPEQAQRQAFLNRIHATASEPEAVAAWRQYIEGIDDLHQIPQEEQNGPKIDW